jgi:predicted RNase H-like HicB family nuclease
MNEHKFTVTMKAETREEARKELIEAIDRYIDGQPNKVRFVSVDIVKEVRSR